MFKYATSTKMEVLNLSLGSPNYSALLFVKLKILLIRIISQEYVAYNLVELIHFKLFWKGTYHFRLMDIGDIPNTESAVVLPK
ncbi:hypothetical protein MKW98_022619 [Papaver atlanticum]|uniref:Uncharacterized protein n=1 Tax=Papaver atlanticum TaxID=357466 RepID=A0AAD4SKH5_9MAGN|nr:hypothetical protein MKW98_022619 [Papaver atlanticum]